MAVFDTIISGGRICDGTGSPAFHADIGISGGRGRIAAVGALSRASAREVIDARGMVVAPGYVSQHSHYDVQLFWDPYCSNAGENGVTSVVNANCGFGLARIEGLAKRDRPTGATPGQLVRVTSDRGAEQVAVTGA